MANKKMKKNILPTEIRYSVVQNARVADSGNKDSITELMDMYIVNHWEKYHIQLSYSDIAELALTSKEITSVDQINELKKTHKIGVYFNDVIRSYIDTQGV